MTRSGERETSKPTQAVFLDNGLSRIGEHSHQLLKAVKGALVERGIATHIYGCRRMNDNVREALDATPHFRDRLYDGRMPPLPQAIRHLPSIAKALLTKAPIFSEERTAASLNRRFAEDLARLPPGVWAPGSIIVVPAISQNQIAGLLDQLQGTQERRAPLICQLMFNVDWTPWGARGRLGKEIYAQAFAGFRTLGRPVAFTTENEMMAAHYRQQLGIDPTILPVPLAVEGRRRRRDGRVRIGFFGYSKTEKGFHLLPEAIKLCCATHPDADFVVQIQHSNWEAATIEAAQALRRLGGVTLLEGELSSEDYAKMTSEVDITLLPYDPIRFGPRGSGIFTEAAASGRPVVASEGLAAAAAVRKGDAAGEVFSPYSSEALAAAILRLIDRLDTCLEEGSLLAERFARTHDGNAYVDVLLALAAAMGGPQTAHRGRPRVTCR